MKVCLVTSDCFYITKEDVPLVSISLKPNRILALKNEEWLAVIYTAWKPHLKLSNSLKINKKFYFVIQVTKVIKAANTDSTFLSPFLSSAVTRRDSLIFISCHYFHHGCLSWQSLKKRHWLFSAYGELRGPISHLNFRSDLKNNCHNCQGTTATRSQSQWKEGVSLLGSSQLFKSGVFVLV